MRSSPEKPRALFDRAVVRLVNNRVPPPGVATPARMVAAVRQEENDRLHAALYEAVPDDAARLHPPPGRGHRPRRSRGRRPGRESSDAAFVTWVPQRRSQIHKAHREVIGERAARDHAALKPLPPTPYLVAERRLRPVGQGCLVVFGDGLCSEPATTHPSTRETS